MHPMQIIKALSFRRRLCSNTFVAAIPNLFSFAKKLNYSYKISYDRYGCGIIRKIRLLAYPPVYNVLEYPQFRNFPAYPVFYNFLVYPLFPTFIHLPLISSIVRAQTVFSALSPDFAHISSMLQAVNSRAL